MYHVKCYNDCKAHNEREPFSFSFFQPVHVWLENDYYRVLDSSLVSLNDRSITFNDTLVSPLVYFTVARFMLL